MKELHDFYFKKAKKENYLARSIYKIEEIDKKYKIIRKNDTIIDLGCAPGSWIEYTLKVIGSKGKILGIDLKGVKKTFPENVKIIKGNIYDMDNFSSFIENNNTLPEKFNLVISDMAPNTSGQKDVDSYKSFQLATQALIIADKFLKSGGNFIVKIFMGEDFKSYLDSVRKSFERTKVYKPKSSRNESFETYIIAWQKKEKIELPDNY